MMDKLLTLTAWIVLVGMLIMVVGFITLFAALPFLAWHFILRVW